MSGHYADDPWTEVRDRFGELMGALSLHLPVTRARHERDLRNIDRRFAAGEQTDQYQEVRMSEIDNALSEVDAATDEVAADLEALAAQVESLDSAAAEKIRQRAARLRDLAKDPENPAPPAEGQDPVEPAEGGDVTGEASEV